MDAKSHHNKRNPLALLQLVKAYAVNSLTIHSVLFRHTCPIFWRVLIDGKWNSHSTVALQEMQLLCHETRTYTTTGYVYCVRNYLWRHH